MAPLWAMTYPVNRQPEDVYPLCRLVDCITADYYPGDTIVIAMSHPGNFCAGFQDIVRLCVSPGRRCSKAIGHLTFWVFFSFLFKISFFFNFFFFSRMTLFAIWFSAAYRMSAFFFTTTAWMQKRLGSKNTRLSFRALNYAWALPSGCLCAPCVRQCLEFSTRPPKVHSFVYLSWQTLLDSRRLFLVYVSLSCSFIMFFFFASFRNIFPLLTKALFSL